MFQQNRATRASAPPPPRNLNDDSLVNAEGQQENKRASVSARSNLFTSLSSPSAPSSTNFASSHASPGKPIAPIEISGFKTLPQVPKFGEDPQKIEYVTGNENAAPRMGGKEVKSMMQAQNIIEQHTDRQPFMESTFLLFKIYVNLLLVKH